MKCLVLQVSCPCDYPEQMLQLAKQLESLLTMILFLKAADEGLAADFNGLLIIMLCKQAQKIRP